MSLFENHKAALAFAGVVLVGTAIFAESQPDKANETSPEVITANEPKRVAQSDEDPEEALSDDELAEAGWATDDDLIDDAIGFSTEPEVDAIPDESTQPDSERDSEVVVDSSEFGGGRSRSATTSRAGISVSSNASGSGPAISLGPNARVGNSDEEDTE